jgi:vacuolar-type H+-ATPase subunit E/Vma4
MPLEKILQALEAETERLVAEIDQAARTEVEQIRRQAEADAAIAREKHLTAVQSPLRAEQARILNRAKLEALQIVLGTREDLITAVLDAVACRLKALPCSETYPSILRQLTQEAIEALGANSICLRVRSSDLSLVERITRQMGLSITVEGGLENDQTVEGDGIGVVATSADGRISLVNTLTARLRRVAGLHRAYVVQLIFEDPQEP